MSTSNGSENDNSLAKDSQQEGQDNCTIDTSKMTSDDKDRMIATLHNELSQKNGELTTLQRGLETQVHMVMELERLEQKEMRDYEMKLDANQRVIRELGERVGQESRAKAELESQLTFVRRKSEDQAAQLARIEELNSVHQALLKDFKQDHTSDSNNPKWEIYTKLEESMDSNQKLLVELEQKNIEVQGKRQELSDKEMLCIELSSQLNNLATQLNDADEEMAKYKARCEEAEDKAKKCEERVQLLEKSLLENTKDGDADENQDSESLQGAALLLKTLKEKEELLEKVSNERNVSLNKATSLSIALATTREHNDALQEKLQYQNNIVDRILGKSHRVPVPTPPTAATTDTTPSPRYSGQVSSSYSQPGDHIQSNIAPTPTPKRSTPGRSFSGDGLFTGQRIRTFFANRRGGPGANAADSVSSSAADSSPPAMASSTNNTATPRNSGNASTSAATPATPKTPDATSVDPKVTASSTHNPFDDDEEDAFANPAVGNASQVAEDSAGGGGDVNLALTL